jgi:hypothetical protein
MAANGNVQPADQYASYFHTYITRAKPRRERELRVVKRGRQRGVSTPIVDSAPEGGEIPTRDSCLQ